MKRTKKDPKTISAILAWLSGDGNTEAKLAEAMAYTSNTTVSQWLRRGRVPEHQRVRILTFIKENP
jgi:DNA-binding transcriptional regulator YiaG